MACFFGFGSLVNTGTHRYEALTPASVIGWQRVWINNDSYEHAFLSIVPKASSQIQGLMAKVPNDDWVELDAREVGYARRVLTESEWFAEASSSFGIDQKPDDVQMYVHVKGEYAEPQKPILWSYLETVLYGYYQWFGAEGVHALVDSTIAWTDILDDRKDPIYPRYVPATGNAVEIVIPTIQAIQNQTPTIT